MQVFRLGCGWYANPRHLHSARAKDDPGDVLGVERPFHKSLLLRPPHPPHTSVGPRRAPVDPSVCSVEIGFIRPFV